MSFPGYLKSLKLKAKHNEEAVETSRFPGEFKATRTRIKESVRSAERKESVGQQVVMVTPEEDTILDERDNGPSRSLWVGNIPLRTTSSEIRALFSRFGTIVSTKPAAKYAFVNFETTESAIAAFRQYHDKDVFNTGSSTINIRFTHTLAEAKQVKGDGRGRKSSMTAKAEAAQKLYFQPVVSSKETPKPKPAIDAEWPNGMPPSGPKSQRCDVSPPSLRRGDSYRPAGLSRGDSYRSDDYARSDTENPRRGRNHRRPSDHYYSPAYSPACSRSSSRTGSSLASQRRHGTRGDESPLPWERQKSDTQVRNLVRTKVNGETHVYEDSVVSSPATIKHDQIRFSGMKDTTTRSDENLILPDSPIDQTTDEIRHDGGSDPRIVVESVSSPVVELSQDTLDLASFNRLQRRSKSPSLRLLEKLKFENGSNRGSSVLSEVATTSSRASAKRRRCHDCRKPGTDLSPLVPCSRCRRRLHAGCGEPRPSSCQDKSQFVCGECQRKQEVEGISACAAAAAAAVKTKSVTQLNGRVHLVSPPLSLKHDSNGSTDLSPRDELPHDFTDKHRLESFFPKRTEDAEKSMNPQASQKCRASFDNQQDNSVEENRINRRSVPSTPISSTARNVTLEEALNRKTKYKIVTCKFWTSGNCTQTEEGCYYAHHYTDVSIPDRRKPNKNWTCYEWLQNRCGMPEKDCMFAHNDTGLHVWKDGRPSFKHVTCFWWSKGKCKWDKESCKFGHEDTGLYSLDPSEIWQGGSKFTVVPPTDTSNRAFQHGLSTGDATSPVIQQLTETTHLQDQGALRQPTGQKQNNQASWVVTKPLLTINTTANSSASHSISFADMRLILGNVGAAPETPSYDSPDKMHSRSFDLTTAMNRSSQNMSDLPTPGIEDQTIDEQAQSDYIGTVRLPVRDVPLDPDVMKGRNTVHSDNILHVERHNLVSDDCAALSDNSTKQRCTAATAAMSQSFDASKDPRLLRSSCDPNNKQMEDVNPETSPGTSGITPTSRDSYTRSNDDGSRRGVKRCQRCQKPVFASALCRVCTNSNGDAVANMSPDRPDQQQTVEIGASGQTPSNPKTSDVLMKDLEFVRAAPVLQPAPKNPLKRNSSGSNMFLKNKRPRNSMLFSSSGSIRPDMFRRASVTKKPHIRSLGSDKRREAQPTLDDLINEERAKNIQKRTDPVIDTTIVESPVSIDQRDNKTPESPRDTPPAHVGPPSPERLANRRAPVEDTYSPSTLASADLFSSPLQSPCKPYDSPSRSAQNTLNHDRASPRRSETSPSPSRPSREISLWRNSESPQPQPDLAALQTVSEVTEVLDKPLNHQSSGTCNVARSPVQLQRPAMPQRSSSRDIMFSHRKFSWASSITCTQCQKNHKKCLHGNDGSLSAVKCREYVKSRNGKPDSGRSRQEWNAILEAGEHSPDSEDDFTEDEDIESTEDIVSSETEDDFTTAVGGDEIIANNDMDDHDALLEVFKKPPPRVDLSLVTRKTSNPITRFFSRRIDDDWTAEDEKLKLDQLKARGVMFETDSEDGDYGSEADTPALSRQRPIDPLYVPPKISADLFEVAPELDHCLVVQEMSRSNTIEPRPSRKEQWAQLRSRQLQDRRERFGNPHWEVNRMRTGALVTAFVQRIVPPKNTDDRFAVGSVQTREEEVSFCDFLGAPKIPEICLMNDGERLGFRDGQRERDRIYGRTGRELCRRMTDDEKWLIRAK